MVDWLSADGSPCGISCWALGTFCCWPPPPAFCAASTICVAAAGVPVGAGGPAAAALAAPAIGPADSRAMSAADAAVFRLVKKQSARDANATRWF